MPDESVEPEEQTAEGDEGQNGHEEEFAEYETELARYLEARIKPNLSASAIPLMARSIAKEIARKKPAEGLGGGNGGGEDEASSPPDFEADMHEFQQELGDDWILRFSVRDDEAWLTAEKEDSSQRVDAPDAERLARIVEAINEGGGRQG